MAVIYTKIIENETESHTHDIMLLEQVRINIKHIICDIKSA